MCRLDKLQELRSEIYRIAQKHKAGRIYVFGSCVRKEERPDSDVDFLVEFDDASLFDHIRLEKELSEYLQIPVDVISSKALKQDHFGMHVRQEMIPL